MNGKATWVSVGGLVAVAAALRGIHLDWGLPEVFEEATPVREAIEMWGDPGQGIDLNPHFFKYPSLTFYFNFILQSAWYLWLSLAGAVGSLNEFRQVLGQDFARAVLLGRWFQVACGSLAVIPTVLLARRLCGTAAGWCAGAALAVLPTAVHQSQQVGPDVALALFTAAALVSATTLADRGRRSDYLWCGVWIGLATACKYPGALLVVALITGHVITVRRNNEGAAGILFSNLFWQSLVTALVVLFAASPYVLFDASTALQDLGFERRHMALGHLGREEGAAWGYYLGRVIPRGWTWGIAGSALVGLGLLLSEASTRRRVLPGVVFVATMLLVLGSWKMAAPRYMLPLAPVGAGWVGAAAVMLPRRLRLQGRPGRAAVAVIAVLALAWPLLTSVRSVGFRGRPDSRIAAASWIQNNVPGESAILVERYGPEPDPERLKVLYLPFHAITPHIYDAAYSPWLYTTFDYVVLSSGVSARYLAKPRLYPHQIAFYRAMDSRLENVALFTPGIYTGPEIRILKRVEGSWPDPPPRLQSAYFAAQKGNTALSEYVSALGTVLVRQGRETIGFPLLQEAIDMDPENPKAWGNLGAMRLRAGLLEEARSAFLRAETLAPDDPDVLYNLGTLYAEAGEWSQSADAYRKVLKFRPEMEEAYLGLARVLVAEDHYAEARVVLRTFLLRFPRSARVPSAEEALRQLANMGPGH